MDEQLPLQWGKPCLLRVIPTDFSPWTTMGLTSSWPPHAWWLLPLSAPCRGGFWRYLFSFAAFPPFRTSLSWRPLKTQMRRKPLCKDAAAGMPPLASLPALAPVCTGGCSKMGYFSGSRRCCPWGTWAASIAAAGTSPHPSACASSPTPSCSSPLVPVLLARPAPLSHLPGPRKETRNQPNADQ